MIRETRVGLEVDLDLDFDAAVERTTEALKTQGFGVLTAIDVQATLREKLGRHFRRYTILGACNPSLAERALLADLDVGLLLPCNVIVYEREEGESTVAAMAPLAVIGALRPAGDLEAVASEADRRLRDALSSLEG